MNDEKKKDDGDPRLEYIGSYVTKTFRIKSDKWQKLTASEEKVTKPSGSRWIRQQTNYSTLSTVRDLRLAG